MTAGHFGLAAGMKRWAPRLPLWALMLSTYALDIVFIGFLAAGLEWLTPVDPNHVGYGGYLIHAQYTHSLVGALIISAIVGWLGSRWWGRRGGVLLAAVAFSHWLLDLVVHRPDLPILPANWGNLPLLGFGLWTVPALSAVVELLFVLGGAYFYYRAAAQLPTPAGTTSTTQQRRVWTTVGVTTGLLLLLLFSDVLGL